MSTANLKWDGFSFRGQGAKELFCEDVPLSRIAAEVGTPTYVYSKAAISNRVRALKLSLAEMNCKIFFAVKSCSNVHILKLLRNEGCGADIVSGGELFRAAMAGIHQNDIAFSGVGKSEDELREALKARIYSFNIESAGELLLLEKLCAEEKTRARALLRVNPDVDAKTHPHISTGLKQNKFGLSASELKAIYKIIPSLSQVKVFGLSCHIGSQILSTKPFLAAWKALLKAADEAPFKIEHLDLGGGLGVAYGKEKAITLAEYGRLIKKTFAGKPFEIGIEPGRSLIAPAAMLLSRVIQLKKRGSKTYYVCDAGMNDLIRPALYGATHPVSCVNPPQTRSTQKVDLVGPICETSDTFQRDARLPPLEPGALIAFGAAGAYAMSMASQYNSRPRGAEVLVDGSDYAVIRKRETYADLIQHEIL